MYNLERSEFDEQWKDAFVKAEVAPSASVWANLDRELTLAEGEDDKKRVVFYQRLAAACILFALLGGSFGVYHWKQNGDQIAQSSSVKVSENTGKSSENKIQADQASAKTDGSNLREGSASNSTGESKTDNSKIDRNQPEDKGTSNSSVEQLSIVERDEAAHEKEMQNAVVDNKGYKDSNTWLAINTDLPRPGLLPIGEVEGEPRYEEIVRKLPYVPSVFMNESRREKFNHEKLWASVSAASGTYSESAGSSYNSVAAFKLSNYSLQSSTPTGSIAAGPTTTPTVGRSYSYGVIGGVRIAERWVLQTGVQYLNQTLENGANSALLQGGSIVSTSEFVSIPVQAGYLLLDRKIGWQLNPGVSTDFFVKNTLSNQQQSVSQGAGSDSPYRSVNFAGLMSSEVSYKLGKNYRLSLVPGLRYSPNSAMKSQTTGNALTWDVGFRFRYIFK